MLPSLRLLVLLLLTAPIGAVGGLGRPAAVLLALAALLAAVVDWWLARDYTRVQVTRAVEDKLSLAEWNVVTLAVVNRLARPAQVVVRDTPPPEFALEPAARARAHSLPPREERTLTYRVQPRHRGDYAFGALYVRVMGPLGLVSRQRQVPATAARVRVYPSLRQLRRYELLVRRGLLAEEGLKAVRAPGASTEFERLREYVPDDEFRRINWKATARRGKPIVNQFEAERSQNVVLMLDAGRLMGARADSPVTDEGEALVQGEAPLGLTKLDYAVNAALLLAYVAGLRGDRVALLAYADEVRTFQPPTRGRRAFLRTVDALYNLEPEPVEPDHGAAFQFLATRNLRRSLVVLFTDLADRESSRTLVAHLMRAARQHLVVCVTLGDPTVARPAAAAPTDTQALYEKMVAQRLLDERAAVLATLVQRGVYSLDTEADTLSPSLIDAYLQLKQRAKI